eukprot:456645_1
MYSKNDKDSKENKWIDWVYDTVTVLISIADITTDIIVLLSFYYQSRTVFFIISLCILILSQIAYSIVFIWRYDVWYDHGLSVAVPVFFALLPFGFITSFIIMFTDDPDSWFTELFGDITHLDTRYSIRYDNMSATQNKKTQWMIKKLSKNIGFITEAAIEAIPQSLLQLIAIVYYKEANIISIISIFLSMFSVMTKSIVFSQGIDIKTYIWTWLCIVVDFFGIFFTLSWVFYTNNTLLQPIFLGYFSIIAKIWFYKVIISIIPVVIAGIGAWFTFILWKLLLDEIWTGYPPGSSCATTSDICTNMAYSFFLIIGGSIGVLLVAPVGLIGLEIFCFSFCAFGVWTFGTERWANYSHNEVNTWVNQMLDFIHKPSVFNHGDRMIRMLSVNHSISTNISSWYRRSTDLNTYANKIYENHGLDGLKKITFRDLRKNCGDANRQRIANFLPQLWDNIRDEAPSKADYEDCLCCHGSDCVDKMENWCEYVIFYWSIIILLPGFVIGKLFQCMFPYVIIGYLLYENHWNEIHLFQIVMLLTYIGLQIILFILGLMVFQTQYYLWHIQPGIDSVHLRTSSYVKNKNTLNTFIDSAEKWYFDKTYVPLIHKFILEMYGNDIGNIIMDYFHNIEISKNENINDKKTKVNDFEHDIAWKPIARDIEYKGAESVEPPEHNTPSTDDTDENHMIDIDEIKTDIINDNDKEIVKPIEQHPLSSAPHIISINRNIVEETKQMEVRIGMEEPNTALEILEITDSIPKETILAKNELDRRKLMEDIKKGTKLKHNNNSERNDEELISTVINIPENMSDDHKIQ